MNPDQSPDHTALPHDAKISADYRQWAEGCSDQNPGQGISSACYSWHCLLLPQLFGLQVSARLFCFFNDQRKLAEEAQLALPLDGMYVAIFP
jgi:hypothetical protein